jgi:hypothetical protein
MTNGINKLKDEYIKLIPKRFKNTFTFTASALQNQTFVKIILTKKNKPS